ncbi:legumain-like isoform X2, partial [Clarias magur]
MLMERRNTGQGPNASASAEAKGLEAGAMDRVEPGRVSAVAGPVGVKLGLGFDTGVSVSPTKVEVKLLGTGVILGSKMGIALFG